MEAKLLKYKRKRLTYSKRSGKKLVSWLALTPFSKYKGYTLINIYIHTYMNLHKHMHKPSSYLHTHTQCSIPSSLLQPLLIYAVNVATGRTGVQRAPVLLISSSSAVCGGGVHVEAVKDSPVPSAASRGRCCFILFCFSPLLVLIWIVLGVFMAFSMSPCRPLGGDGAGGPASLPHGGRAWPRPLHHRLRHPRHRHYRHRGQLPGHIRLLQVRLRTVSRAAGSPQSRGEMFSQTQ